jgi:hypothetical protein
MRRAKPGAIRRVTKLVYRSALLFALSRWRAALADRTILKQRVRELESMLLTAEECEALLSASRFGAYTKPSAMESARMKLHAIERSYATRG